MSKIISAIEPGGNVDVVLLFSCRRCKHVCVYIVSYQVESDLEDTVLVLQIKRTIDL